MVTTDFGLARVARSGGSLTTVGMLVGTPEYWSPEQALGRETGTATDLYALGCILYLLIGGRLPFEGDDRLAVGLRRAHEQAPSLMTPAPEVPAAADLVDSLLSTEPGGRPDAATTAALLSALAVAPQWPARPVERENDAPLVVTLARPAARGSDAWPTVSGAAAAAAAASTLPRSPGHVAAVRRPVDAAPAPAGGPSPASARARRRRRQPVSSAQPLPRACTIGRPGVSPKSSRSVRPRHVLRSSSRCRTRTCRSGGCTRRGCHSAG